MAWPGMAQSRGFFHDRAQMTGSQTNTMIHISSRIVTTPAVAAFCHDFYGRNRADPESPGIIPRTQWRDPDVWFPSVWTSRPPLDREWTDLCRYLGSNVGADHVGNST